MKQKYIYPIEIYDLMTKYDLADKKRNPVYRCIQCGEWEPRILIQPNGIRCKKCNCRMIYDID